MSASLVGSEMCIRDRVLRRAAPPAIFRLRRWGFSRSVAPPAIFSAEGSCLLYTSDAADDM
eukprot:7041486-Alexandrium_andersonii.AAC.1